MPFDPYLRWLGIRDDEQPPNHYKLLGVELFESDPDVIATAADRQMAHVRRYQNGPHSAASQKVLNELAVAKLCLLDLAQKSKYDKWLSDRAKETQALQPTAVVIETPTAIEPHFDEPQLPAADATAVIKSPHLAAERLRRDRPKSILPLVLAATVLVLLAAIPTARFFLKSIPPELTGGLIENDTDSSPDRSESEPPATLRSSSPIEAPPPAPSSTSEAASVEPAEASVDDVAVTGGAAEPVPDVITDDATTDQVTSVASSTEQPQPEMPATDATSAPATSPDAAINVARPEPEASSKSTVVQPPVPDESELTKTRQQFNQVYASQIEQALGADEPNAAHKLAGDFYQKAMHTADNLPVQFVLFTEALNLAIRSGNTAVAERTANEIANHFDIDPVTASVNAVQRAAPEIAKLNRSRGVTANLDFCTAVIPLAQAALDRDDFEQANTLLKILTSSARKARSRAPNLESDVAALRETWQQWRREHAKMLTAKQLIAQLPGDRATSSLDRTDLAQANWTVGYYYGLIKGDMATAAPYLIASGHSTLSSIAEIEQIASEADAESQFDLAKQWLQFAKSGRTLADKPIDEAAAKTAYQRAKHWFDAALPSLTGLNRSEGTKLLSEATAALAADTAGDSDPHHALVFDGRKSQIVVPEFRYDGSRPLIIEAVLKPASTTASYSTSATIVSNATPRSGFALTAEGGVWQFRFATDGQRDLKVRTTGRIQPGVWTRLVASYDGQQISLAQDAAPPVRQPTPSRYTASAKPLSIGASLGGNQNVPPESLFRGELAMLRIFFSPEQKSPVIELGPDQIENRSRQIISVDVEKY